MVVVPCIGTQTYVTDKRDIEPTARRLLAQMTGFAPEQIHLDLTAGRVVDNAEELAAARSCSDARAFTPAEHAAWLARNTH
ncbi:hypothetical protein [Nocardia cyriacigeorgica]|uniref:hypothetical protein n=1 Tax=Nocardia cyriacigeorgica TaxID=135487 RepID=UPI0006625DA5|nr:hypothetical protein [Nocardia cyriacigeorgica]